MDLHLFSRGFEANQTSLMYVLIRIIVPCLVFAAFTQLQTGQDLTFNGLDPGVSFLHTGGFEVPGLTSAGHNQEVKVVLI